ncbi:methylglyoxal synthase [Bacteroidota bacterium]
MGKTKVKLKDNQEIIILLATKSMRKGPNSSLIKFVREFQEFWVETKPAPYIFALEGCYRAIIRNGLLHNYEQFYILPSGIDGGIVYASDLVISDKFDTDIFTIEKSINKAKNSCLSVFYFIDPSDPTSMYPETIALKRDCVVKDNTFISSYSGAYEWSLLQWYVKSNRKKGDFSKRRYLIREEIDKIENYISKNDLNSLSTIALVAHDQKKVEILEFADKYFDFLFDNFIKRYATGTTGELLNGIFPKDLSNKGITKMQKTKLEKHIKSIDKKLKIRKTEKWIAEDINSGPKGGDVQIARKILDKKCHKIIFFEDTQVAREHEADIQLLERASRVPNLDIICLHDKNSAQSWADNWEKCLQNNIINPMTIVRAYRKLFNVELVLTEDITNYNPTTENHNVIWDSILQTSAFYIVSLINKYSYSKSLNEKIRVGLTWGVSMHELINNLNIIKTRLAEKDGEIKNKKLFKKGSDSLFVELNDSKYFKIPNLLCLPTIGVIGSTNPAVEANENAKAHLSQPYC